MLHPKMPPAEAVRVLVGACLTPALARVARLVAETGDAEDLHRLRVDLRRLRSVLRFAQDWVPWTLPLPALAALFARLGAARDREVLETQWLPALRAAGAPQWDLPPIAPECQPAEVLRSPAARQLLDELAALSRGPAPAGALPSGGHLRRRVRDGLDEELRWLRRRARHADQLGTESLHAVRKRAKRLRYVVELTASLFGRRKVAVLLRELAALQDTLGGFNDAQTARALFTDLAQTDARAWFAVGWIAARQERALRDSRRALRRFARAHRHG